MTKKYILAGAVAAFLAAANVAYAPISNQQLPKFQEPKITISTGNFLERYAQENEEKIHALLKELDDLDNYRTRDFNEDSLEILTARLMMGEDEDNQDICKIADTHTALNRLKIGGWYGKTFHEVVLKPEQYSCFNRGTDSNIFLKIPLEHNARDFLRDIQLSKNFWLGRYPDPTNGATHYYNPDKVKGTPDWVKTMRFCGRIGHHLYYKEK